MPATKKPRIATKKEGTPLSKAVKGSGAKGTPATTSSPAQSGRSFSPEMLEDDGEDVEDEDDADDNGGGDGDVYCICRKPDNGTFMIGCDGACDDWFHGKCVGIPECNKNLIDKYICPNCTEQSIGRTTWKRICRYEDCNKPASTLKTRHGADGSKYCADDCGYSYFHGHVHRMRGQGGGMPRSRSISRKKIASANAFVPGNSLGARGGVLAASELKALLNACTTIEDFRRLGENPSLEYSAILEGDVSADPSLKLHPDVAETIQKISQEKDKARRRHAMLKDRIKFVSIVKTAASHFAMEKELKAKDFCGYDRRLEWSDQEFLEWRELHDGKVALENEALLVAATEQDSGHEDGEASVCDRKRCLRHNDWQKLAIDSLRHEVSENSDHMRALESDEAALRERIMLTKLGRGEGEVEVHTLSTRQPRYRLMHDSLSDAEGGKIDGHPDLCQEDVEKASAAGVSAGAA